jgi:hypothetical protein
MGQTVNLVHFKVNSSQHKLVLRKTLLYVLLTVNYGILSACCTSYNEALTLLYMPSGTMYRVVLVLTDVYENVSSLSSGFLGVIGFHSCVTVELLVLSLSNTTYGRRTLSSGML